MDSSFTAKYNIAKTNLKEMINSVGESECRFGRLRNGYGNCKATFKHGNTSNTVCYTSKRQRCWRSLTVMDVRF